MGEFEVGNLIDFSAEDLIQIQPPHRNLVPSQNLMESSSEGLTPALKPVKFSSTTKATPSPLLKQDSLENNPFDIVQKMASRPADPFDIVEKEACQKARLIATPLEVKEGKLLSFSNDSIHSETVENVSNAPNTIEASQQLETETRKFGRDTERNRDLMTTRTNNERNDSDASVSAESKLTPDSDNTAYSVNSIETTPTSTNAKRTRDNRKRLLKLSLSNSTYNSSTSRHAALPSDSFADHTISMILSEAAQLGEHSLAQESPLKLVDDDDLLPPEANCIDNQQAFENDLEMLKIPILTNLPSSTHDTQHTSSLPPETNCREDEIDAKKIEPLTDLAAIRTKLRVKHELSHNYQDVGGLIKSLKSLIADINVGDEDKKKQATSLLDTLSSTLTKGTVTSEQGRDVEATLSSPPTTTQRQTIVRQKTFDMELEEKDQKEPSARDITSLPCSDKIPNDMIKSSSTYDGESAEENKDLILPEINVQTAPPQLQINDIVDQLGQILEQYQLNNVHSSEADLNGGSQTAAINPTFIVVMNTPQTTLTQPPFQNSNQRVGQETFLNNDSHLDLSENNDTAMRRRSQSLSIHDKIKVVHLPMRQPVHRNLSPAPVGSQTLRSSYIDSLPLSTFKDEPKTPSRMRRNSFSNGTPGTSRYSHFASTVRRHTNAFSSQLEAQGLSALKTHHEGQEYSHPGVGCPMQNLNLNSSKLQMAAAKKRLKSDSILTASAPMKATIPVKNVVPSVVSPVNTSVELLAKTPCISTPLATPHSTSTTLDVSSGFPNACSTPTVRTSPMKRSLGAVRSRYSYLSATPSARHSAASTAANTSISTSRRRTISEFKAKSPIKPRVSCSGGFQNAGVSSTVKAAAGLTKIIDKTSSNISRAMAPPPANGRNPIRGRSTRISFGATVAPHRNKENKHP